MQEANAQILPSLPLNSKPSRKAPLDQVCLKDCQGGASHNLFHAITMGLSFWLLDGTRIEVDGREPGLWHNLGPFPGGQTEGLSTWVLPQLADAFCNLGKMNWELQITILQINAPTLIPVLYLSLINVFKSSKAILALWSLLCLQEILVEGEP